MISKIKELAKTCVLLSTLVMTSQASASLIVRDGGMVYDDVLDITWLQDANYAGTINYVAGTPHYNATGALNWQEAQTWASELVYGGFDDWRLPSVSVTDTDNDGLLDCDWSNSGGTDCGYNLLTGNSEMAYMLYENLGNIPYYDTDGVKNQSGYEVLNSSFIDAETQESVAFDNLQWNGYWSGTDYEPAVSHAWYYHPGTENQYYSNKLNYYYAWAVRDGDVGVTSTSEVPEPGSLVILGLGLMGLGIRQYKK